MRTRNYKADLEELEDDYQEARDHEFSYQFYQYFKPEGGTITEDDVQGFLDSFEFPDVADWCVSEYQSRLESFEDAKYEEMKDAKYETD